MQLAKVSAIVPAGQWNEFFKFEVTLDNGLSGTVFGKTPTLRFAIGEEVNYEQPKPGRLKLDKPNPNYQPQAAAPGSSAPAPQANYSVAKSIEISSSKEAALANACTVLAGTNSTKEQVVFLAEYFENWLEGKAPAQVQQVATAGGNDLPF